MSLFTEHTSLIIPTRNRHINLINLLSQIKFYKIKFFEILIIDSSDRDSKKVIEKNSKKFKLCILKALIKQGIMNKVLIIIPTFIKWQELSFTNKKLLKNPSILRFILKIKVIIKIVLTWLKSSLLISGKLLDVLLVVYALKTNWKSMLRDKKISGTNDFNVIKSINDYIS